MLIVPVFVNNTEIDRISLQNVGLVDEKDGVFEYMFHQPPDLYGERIHHTRKEGYITLLQKALTLLEERRNERKNP